MLNARTCTLMSAAAGGFQPCNKRIVTSLPLPYANHSQMQFAMDDAKMKIIEEEPRSFACPFIIDVRILEPRRFFAQCHRPA
ncbi:hypothetical protein HDV62DRAFT_366873 [Trichoderma sp. SZMC 28011]